MAELTFHPAAAEYEEALCWYAERSSQAAEAFDEAVWQALREIELAPHRWPLVDGCHRIKLLLKKYPYHIVYLVDDGTLTVIAVAHHRRKPGYWQNRHLS
jgi:plasmid stabilization system protein ParE